jgi:valyl-tRNA synthetase
MQNDFPEGAIQSIVDEAVFAIHLNEVIDIAAEANRLKKEISKVEQEIAKISGKLSNKGFLEKAPDAVIEVNKSRLQDEQSKLEKLETALDRLN